MSKERLKEIKNGTYLFFGNHKELKKDMDWLIEQAERVQELEKENQLLYGKLNNIQDEINRKIGE